MADSSKVPICPATFFEKRDSAMLTIIDGNIHLRLFPHGSGERFWVGMEDQQSDFSY